MPIRTASLHRRIEKNGATLHRAMMARIQSRGADEEPTEAEQALIEQRRQLKEEQAKRHTEGPRPKAHAADKLVRTHHAQPKDKVKVKKEPKEAKAAAKAAKGHMTRTEKHAAKAAALDAAKKAAKKSAKA